MRCIDETILKMKTNNFNATLSINVKPFPIPPKRIAKYDIISAFGIHY